MTRRRALVGGAALLGGLAAPLIATQAGDARGRALPDLAELPLQRRGRDVTTTVEAARCAVDVAGREVDFLCYNGVYPGPLLRLRQDDVLRLAFRNALDQPTNLHTHGLAVSPEGHGDNPFVRVDSGGGRDYAFDLRGDGRNCGLFWYHPHHHLTDARQLAAGLAGPIIVDGDGDPGALLGPHDERVLVLKDFRIGAHGLRFHRPSDWLMGLEGELLLANGAAEPVLEARERRLRLRIANASNARYWNLAIPGAEALAVVALDGHTAAEPLPVDHIELAPGQRADLVVDLPGDGPVPVVDRPVPRVVGKGRRVRQVMSIVPPARARAALAPLPRRLAPPRPVVATAATREVVFSLFYICGQSYGGPNAPPLFRPRFGTRETWHIWNADTMDHPFHLHTWPFRVISLDEHPVEGQPLRDTLNIPPNGRAEISVDFDGVTGKSMFHCHIAEHAAKGMMATLEVES